MKINVKNIAFTAVFASLCCVATLIIILPLPNGYVNLGDIFVILSGWCLGPFLGGIASGVGCMIADIVSGYVAYAPITFVVKFLVSICAYVFWFMFKKLISRHKFDFITRIFSAVIGEFVMVAGYFVYESFLYGFAGGALALLGNSLQGVICAVSATLVAIAMYNVKYFKTVFPYFDKKINDDK